MKVFVLTMAVLLLMGATGIQASDDNSANTSPAKLSRPFSTVEEAAKAIWTSSGRKDVCSTYVDGPIQGNPTNFYRVSFFTPDYKFRHGLAGTIVVDGDQFRVAIGGGRTIPGVFHR